MPPATIGRYHVIDQIGAGGFATVYRAHDPVLDRTIAIKVLHPHLASDPQIRERFVREGRALARVHHPNLVQVFDAGEAGGQTYLAMEFIAGRPLAVIGEGRQMPLAEVVPVIRQVAAALDAIHVIGLVHRDVKPANILVTESGRAVLLDLGIARAVDNPGLTTSGLIVGTPSFLAPEQVDGAAPVGPATDVYQLGATVYTLLAGRPPYTGDMTQVLYAVANRPPPFLGDLRPDLPPRVLAAVVQSMAKDPARRPPTPAALAGAIAGEQATATTPAAVSTSAATAPSVMMPGAEHEFAPAQQTPVHAMPLPATPRARGRTRRPWPVIAGIVGGLLAIALIGGALLFTRAGEQEQDASTAGAGSAGVPAAGGDTRDAVVITPGGPPVEVAITKRGRPATLAFDGAEGQRVSIRLARMTVDVSVSILKPDGLALLRDSGVSADEGFIDVQTLPVAGRYEIRFAADEEQTGTLAVTLYDVPPDAAGTIAPGGSPVTIRTAVPGQNAELTFSGNAGQRVSLRLARMTVGGYVSIIRPDGLELLRPQSVSPSEAFIDRQTLPTAGTYTILLDPENTDTGTVTLTLNDVPPDITTPITPGGPPVTVTTVSPGQNAALTFTGSVGQRVGLRLTRMSIGVSVSIVRPDGSTVLAPTWVSADEGTIDPLTLPAAGPYEIVIDPEDDETGGVTVSLVDAPR